MEFRTSSALFILVLIISAALIGGATGYLIYSLGDLPQIQALEEYRPNIASRVYSQDNKLLAEFFLEYRRPVTLNDVPEILIKALIATEDRRFFNHHGIDFRGVARALFRNIRARKILEGGSTLTQQLAKVLFLTPERKYTRKLKEMALALKIEQRYTKNEILTMYLNQIYFGNGAYGIEAASQIYFGKAARDLSVAECALLAGLPRSPKYYSPFKAPEQAKMRRAYVLNRMVEAGVITALQAEEVKNMPLPLQVAAKPAGRSPYFVELVRQRVEERFGSSILYSGGLNITTTLNDEMQSAAEEAITGGLTTLDKQMNVHGSRSELQAALLALDPSTGRILAMVGGRNFSASQFNRAWQALRQPGSAFKPIIYAAALEHGFNPSDMLDDSPLTIQVDRKKSWSPENFTHTYQGMVTVRTALAQSLNVPTVRLLEKIGIDSAISYAKQLGIRSPLTRYLPLALGSSDVTLAELTSAYAVFANHGIRTGPFAITSISDSTGRILFQNDIVPQQVTKPETAYLITYLLKGVIEHGTGWKARALGRPVAGKTGTTNDYRDAWFVGYTPNLVAGVWVGYDDQQSLGPKQTGARVALPIWIEFMKKALAYRTADDFTAPSSITFKQIDPRTGLLSTDRCKLSIREAYITGTEPHRFCDEAVTPAPEQEYQDEAP
ncbi:MAG TPA: PBP1A family penicillin-binding protein [Nitrospirota bacterium]|nr:PBP1A family penicillin-binding protein [Nitrospirota bacterium]